MDCPICGGSGFIRLPVREKMNFRATLGEGDIKDIKPMQIREYPCPKCGDRVSIDKVDTVSLVELIPIDELKLKDNSNFLEYIKRRIVAQIGDFLYKEERITYEFGEENYNLRTIPITAKLGVLSPRQVKTLEERINDRRMMFASMVVNDIIKSTVFRICYESLNKVEMGK